MPERSPKSSPESPGLHLLKLHIQGTVQGVGFRPFIYRLASELKLGGWVSNTSHGVFIEATGPRDRLEEFLGRIPAEKPPHSRIDSIKTSWSALPSDADLTAAAEFGAAGFEIRESESLGTPTTSVLPDIATCPECLAEILDPANRRYRYPFTNCTNCGPRYSIIQALPYDRVHTTMSSFKMCEECEREFRDPRNRRFHAQPNCCPKCGPQIELWDQAGSRLAERDDALVQAAQAVLSGKILALKGIGGFHLVADAGHRDAVRALRQRKRREEKPFAVMFPSLDSVRSACAVSEEEAALLVSSQAPIVLLRKLPANDLAPDVAPGNPLLGAFLPYSPLHHLFLRELKRPIVATSGNLSEEPIATDEHEAIERLSTIADLFLVHNRPIARAVDDSVARVFLGEPQIIRRSRGYAPAPVFVPVNAPSALAVGPHLKNTVALYRDGKAFLSQHIGDLENAQSLSAFERTIASLEKLYETEPVLLIRDAHPAYLSSQYAENRAGAHKSAKAARPLAVQHHYAHALSCLAENGLQPPALGVIWDGTGYGPDGTIWGGEFLRLHDHGYDRMAHLRTFRLLGGDAGAREPRRAALAILHEVFGDALFERQDLFALLPTLQAFDSKELPLLRSMLSAGLNSPLTSSMGRLFDAVASLIGLCQKASYEGQAAMRLEFVMIDSSNIAGAASDIAVNESYDFAFNEQVLDWSPMIRGIIEDLSRQRPASWISTRFHNTLVEMICAVVAHGQDKQILLSGGCFQNRYLLERAVCWLRTLGFQPFWNKQVPTNDGGIALGQIVAAARWHPTP